MPLYEYKCQKCNATFDLYFPLQEWDVQPDCPTCGGQGKKVISCHIQRDEPTWLNDEVRGCIQDTDGPHKLIETRTDYKRHLKDNGIVERA